jgi:NADP-dependent 3-hydroxy acid dehydrogenase YdfG
MAGVINQTGSTFSGWNEAQNGDIIQVGSIFARNVNISKHIYNET